MLRCLFKNTKTIDDLESNIKKLKIKIESLEYQLDLEKASIKRLTGDQSEMFDKYCEAVDWNNKFKETLLRLRSEKLELEVENEFLRKKVNNGN